MKAAALLILTACAATPPPLLTRHVRPRPHAAGLAVPAPAADPRQIVVAQARRFLEGAPLVSAGLAFEPDPVGFVRAAYWASEIDLFDAELAADTSVDGMQLLYRSAAKRRQVHHEQPRPGDLVFFDARPSSTALDPAQVAVVESMSKDGTITAIGSFADGPSRVGLNLRRDDGTPLSSGEPASAARLWRAFASPF